MKLIVGLGNPGLRYKNTRHNIGFLAIDNFAKANKVEINKKTLNSLFVKMTDNNNEIALLKPQTFMNNSGEAIKAAISKFGIEPKDILIICDDINLSLGIIRFRAAGSSGGHKGLQSILEKLSTENFNRLRIGIGCEKDNTLKDYVLSKFRTTEKKILSEVIKKTTDAIDLWINEGIEASMNKYNEKNKMEVN